MFQKEGLGLKKISYTVQILLKDLIFCNLCQCSPSSFHYGLSVSFQYFCLTNYKLLFSGFHQFKGNFVQLKILGLTSFKYVIQSCTCVHKHYIKSYLFIIKVGIHFT